MLFRECQSQKWMTTIDASIQMTNGGSIEWRRLNSPQRLFNEFCLIAWRQCEKLASENLGGS